MMSCHFTYLVVVHSPLNLWDNVDQNWAVVDRVLVDGLDVVQAYLDYMERLMALADTCDLVVEMDHCSQVLNSVAVGMAQSADRLVAVDSPVADSLTADRLAVDSQAVDSLTVGDNQAVGNQLADNLLADRPVAKSLIDSWAADLGSLLAHLFISQIQYYRK